MRTMLPITFKRTAIVLLLMLIGLLLFLLMAQSLGYHDGTLTVASIADFSSMKMDPLAGSAPFLRDVEKQKAAGKTLERRWRNGQIQYECKNITMIRNVKEGKRTYCRDKAFEAEPPCLVYSFGIAYDFTFDDYFGHIGCDVFAFDPSMDTPDHRRSRQVMFYQIGLGAEDDDHFEPRLDNYVKQKTTWKVRTLKTLMSMLNHSNTTIDIVKIDVECSEWASVRNMLDSGALRQVKQLLVEWHIFWNCPARERFQQLIALLDDLNRAGFKTFGRPHGNRSIIWETFRLQGEFGYVNTRFKQN